ncbi:MAG: Smr/MutS family protein [Bacteroidetes bacterium]|nr:Smr/MutS family protein [Bacteroidota bacterium]
MPAFKPGDYVAVLNEPIYGTVISSGAKKTKIKDEDGFEREYTHDKLVLAKPLENYRLGDDISHKDTLKTISSFKKIIEKEVVRREPFEIDLHYESLYEEMNLKENYQILQKQLTACRSFVQRAIRNKTRRIVLIHGKGEGVLKTEIHLYLNRLGSEQGVKLDFHDAPYHEYGMGGATEVIFY